MSTKRLFVPLFVMLIIVFAGVGEAEAGPAVGGRVGTSGASGTSSGPTYRENYDWPDLVIGGNALSFIAPFQIGAVGYLPKARFAFQYDRQLSAQLANHWVHVGVGVLTDRGGWRNFRLDDCRAPPTANADGDCEKGGVVGYDLYAGYTRRFFFQNRPWLVPHLKGSLGFSWWALPNVGGSRRQSRIRSWTLNLRPGGGVRIFLLEQLGVGMDLNVPLGIAVHSDVIPTSDGDVDRRAEFLLGFEIMPLLVEFRF